MTTTPCPDKSTIVRTNDRRRWRTGLAIRTARVGFRVLTPHAPGLAARWAERLFLTARRHERPFWEHEALEQAEVGRVDFDGGFLPTWTWSPSPASTSGSLSIEGRDRPTVILVHGWEGRGSQLATFVPALLERGLRVVTFDAPGHGDSPLPRASVVEHARALVAVAHDVGEQNVHAVIGHSVGAASALFATRLGLDAKRFALISPPSSPAKFAAMFSRALRLEASVKDAMIARLAERYAIPFDEIDARIDAARIESPVLVVHDREDPVVAFEEGALLARLAGNRNPGKPGKSKLIETHGLGHRAILRAPHVVDAVARFVAEDLNDRGVEPRASFAATIDGELFFRDTRW